MSTIKVAVLGPPVRNSDGRMAIPVVEGGILTEEAMREALRKLCGEPMSYYVQRAASFDLIIAAGGPHA
jgi:hypothetical protein